MAQPKSLSAWYRHQKTHKECPEAKGQIILFLEQRKKQEASNILKAKMGKDDTEASKPDMDMAG